MIVTKKSFNKVKDLLNNFKEVHKSPYSASFYDRPVSWGEKENGTLRCSDHWNYKTNNDDEVHAVTDKDIDDVWAIGRYNNGVYEIIWSADENYHIEKYNDLIIDCRNKGLEYKEYDAKMLFMNKDNEVVTKDSDIFISSDTEKPIMKLGKGLMLFHL